MGKKSFSWEREAPSPAASRAGGCAGAQGLASGGRQISSTRSEACHSSSTARASTRRRKHHRGRLGGKMPCGPPALSTTLGVYQSTQLSVFGVSSTVSHRWVREAGVQAGSAEEVPRTQLCQTRR